MKYFLVGFDRDGTINKDKDYFGKEPYWKEQLEIYPGVIKGIKLLNQIKNLKIVIATNQAGIARGKYTEGDFELLTEWMLGQFKKENVIVTKIYHCPHHPAFSGECECRKPKPKMILDAQKEFDIDLNQSILVGDKNSDIEAGINAGIGSNFLITTGHKVDKNSFDVRVIGNLKDLI